MIPCLMLLLDLTIVAGHGALVSPLSRNAIDRLINPHPVGDKTCHCSNTTENCYNAQACFWYSQGCSIGCPTCDDINGRLQMDLCGSGMKATINDPHLRTVNRAAAAGTAQDAYKHNPWRAPGYAAVADACGMAGGSPHSGPEWSYYTTTKFAKQGDLGSKVLPEFKTNTVWVRGGENETIWQVAANHGGGYQYRLCPKSESLTEECFQRMPLEFVGKQYLLFNGKRMEINGTYVSEGTWPKGSTWAMSPIPARCLSGDCRVGRPCIPLSPGEPGTPCDDTPDPCFEPLCNESALSGTNWNNGNQHIGNSSLFESRASNGNPCSGNYPNASVIDVIKVPMVKPGEYVLGWRWDCESTAQVWSSCADITIQ